MTIRSSVIVACYEQSMEEPSLALFICSVLRCCSVLLFSLWWSWLRYVTRWLPESVGIVDRFVVTFVTLRYRCCYCDSLRAIDFVATLLPLFDAVYLQMIRNYSTIRWYIGVTFVYLVTIVGTDCVGDHYRCYLRFCSCCCPSDYSIIPISILIRSCSLYVVRWVILLMAITFISITDDVSSIMDGTFIRWLFIGITVTGWFVTTADTVPHHFVDYHVPVDVCGCSSPVIVIWVDCCCAWRYKFYALWLLRFRSRLGTTVLLFVLGVLRSTLFVTRYYGMSCWCWSAVTIAVWCIQAFRCRAEPLVNAVLPPPEFSYRVPLLGTTVTRFWRPICYYVIVPCLCWYGGVVVRYILLILLCWNLFPIVPVRLPDVVMCSIPAYDTDTILLILVVDDDTIIPSYRCSSTVTNCSLSYCCCYRYVLDPITVILCCCADVTWCVIAVPCHLFVVVRYRTCATWLYSFWCGAITRFVIPHCWFVVLVVIPCLTISYRWCRRYCCLVRYGILPYTGYGDLVRADSMVFLRWLLGDLLFSGCVVHCTLQVLDTDTISTLFCRTVPIPVYSSVTIRFRTILEHYVVVVVREYDCRSLITWSLVFGTDTGTLHSAVVVPRCCYSPLRWCVVDTLIDALLPSELRLVNTCGCSVCCSAAGDAMYSVVLFHRSLPVYIVVLRCWWWFCCPDAFAFTPVNSLVVIVTLWWLLLLLFLFVTLFCSLLLITGVIWWYHVVLRCVQVNSPHCSPAIHDSLLLLIRLRRWSIVYRCCYRYLLRCILILVLLICCYGISDRFYLISLFDDG